MMMMMLMITTMMMMMTMMTMMTMMANGAEGTLTIPGTAINGCQGAANTCFSIRNQV